MEENTLPINKEIFRHYWYSIKAVQYEIIKQAKFKEMVFIDKDKARLPVRCMFVYTVDMLKTHFSEFKFFNSPSYNIYLSCAYFKNTQPFSYNPVKRREQMDFWSGKGCPPDYINHWVGYDLFMDFDSQNPDDIIDAYSDMRKTKDMLDHYQVPAIYSFSGTKGFHIRIPYTFLPQNLGLRIVQFCKLIGESIKTKLDLKTLDTGIFDDRRVFKALYTYDRGNICLPLDDAQIDAFNLAEMRVANVLKNVKVFNRGNLMRHSQFSDEQNRNHFLEMFRELKK